MGSEKNAPKGVKTRPQPRAAVVKTETDEVMAALGGEGFGSFEEYFNDLIVDEVGPNFIGEPGKEETYFKILSNIKYLPILQILWKETCLSPATKVAIGMDADGKGHVCTNEVANMLWTIDEERRQRIAKRKGRSTKFLDKQKAVGKTAKADAEKALKQEQRRYVMRVTRVVDAAEAFDLIIKTELRPKNYTAVQGTAKLNKLMKALFLFWEGQTRPVEGC